MHTLRCLIKIAIRRHDAYNGYTSASADHFALCYGFRLMRAASPLLLATCLLTISGSPAYSQTTTPDAPIAPSAASLNANFINPELKVDEWIEKFEVESREVYAARKEVLEACQLKVGESIADIGAGTGFYSRLFARAVGATGWVYSVDISTKFLQHIVDVATKENLHNQTAVLGSASSIRLPYQSVDMIFICDTYHHFEDVPQILASIYAALKPGGRLVVIDFERISGVSSDFILGHVRAGKEVFKGEIEQAGFQFVDEVTIPAFKENYLLRFKKPSE